MTPQRGPAGYDGTTGRTDHGGRRTHIIQLLRDSKAPVSVMEIAETVGIHINTARFHLESLVDAGLAERAQQPRTTPGRPKVLYTGTLPNQTHERAQGYRLLAEALTAAVAQNLPDAGEIVYGVGVSWGRFLTDKPAPFAAVDETQVSETLVAKMDALWFAPALECAAEPDAEQPDRLLLHNCPFMTTAQRNPEVVCSLHAGLINGTLAELGSSRRAVELLPLVAPHRCEVHLAAVDPAVFDSSVQVPIIRLRRPTEEQPT